MKITDLNPFKRNHMDNITKELAILTARRDALLAKQSAAKAALDRALDARQLHLTEGDINDEQISLKKQAAVDTAASAVSGFEIALAAMVAKVIDAQARLDKESQAVAASKASEKLAVQIDILDNLHVKWLETTRAFMVALDDVGLARPEMLQVAGFLRGTVGEIEMAVDVGLPQLRDIVDHIRNGLAPIPKEEPEAAAKPPAPPKPATKLVFSKQALTWIDAGGQQRIVGKWRDVELPLAAANYALSVDLAVPTNDPMCAKTRGHSLGHPEAAWLNNLDTYVGPNIPGSQPAQAPAPTFIRRGANRPFVINNKEGRRS
jgi:hypothetical protein